MRYTPVFAIIALTAGLSAVSAAPAAARGQEKAPAPAASAQPSQIVLSQDEDARETRERLEELLRKLPPAVGRVLRADPSLMGNETYLSTYPTLAAFLKQHPEIRNTPGFFFENMGSYEFWNPSPPETAEARAIRLWSEIFQAITVASVFIGITIAVVWLIRTVVEQRRWYRTSKVHTEVHNKLLDRFTTNEDLMAYIQTDAGRRFLESAPLSVESAPRQVGAPFSRILWSLQVGIVLATGALGLLFVSGRVIEEIAQPLFAIGVLALTVGVGFMVSAAASLILSRRLGLFDPATAARGPADSAPHITG
jgi:hypothetical protein